MTGDKRKERSALDRLSDLLVEDILNASDEDILTELRERNIDAAQNAAAIRTLFETSVIAMNKQRLAAARAGVGADRRAREQASSRPVDIEEARRLLRGVLDASSKGKPLTLAARKEAELSDADVLTMLDNLRELGVLPPIDEGKDA
ncbi:hypothetical protein [Methylocystis sp.]|uniref:hypothetical protein n=1 Tax=Methylocystis sp. TaxID=1911079 RepID=UPI003DA6B339